MGTSKTAKQRTSSLNFGTVKFKEISFFNGDAYVNIKIAIYKREMSVCYISGSYLLHISPPPPPTHTQVPSIRFTLTNVFTCVSGSLLQN